MAQAMELHVGKGERYSYHSIQNAVDAITPGGHVIIHEGIYREEVVLPRGGYSDDLRITIEAAEGERVTISGSDVTSKTSWHWDAGTGLYMLKLPKNYFGKNAEQNYFNPFAVKWMSKGLRKKEFFTCGCVYLGDRVLDQKWSSEEVVQNAYSWYATVDEESGETTIYANFGNVKPEQAEENIEVNRRMQCITAAWNQGYITVKGLHITRGCGPKTIDFWMTNAEAMYGAIAVNGGHHWIVENCDVDQCRGVAIDFGCGSGKQEKKHGGSPKLYGYHILRNNNVHDNGTNGMMAYRGAYTKIYGNKLVNNDALDTGLESEAAIKNVSGGWGIQIHDNYFYSDQDWCSYPIWLDYECDNCRISRNVIYGKGNGKGFHAIDYECNNGWNLIDNNIFVGVGLNLNTSSATYVVNNLWLNINESYHTWPSKNNTAVIGTEGYDGYTRCARIVVPGTLQTIGCDETSRWQTFNNGSKMLGNLFFEQGLTTMPPKGVAQRVCGTEPSVEPAEQENLIYGEMILNRETGPDGSPISDPDYSGGTWKGFLPFATMKEKEALQKYQGKFAWVPADEETSLLWKQQMNDMDAKSPYGCECDENVYCAGAEKIDNAEYGAAHGYHADSQSICVEGGIYEISATPDTFELLLTIPEAAARKKIRQYTGEMLGASACYMQAREKYLPEMSEHDFFPEDVTHDFFGKTRAAQTHAGPFADLKPGESRYLCWPKENLSCE